MNHSSDTQSKTLIMSKSKANERKKRFYLISDRTQKSGPKSSSIKDEHRINVASLLARESITQKTEDDIEKWRTKVKSTDGKIHDLSFVVEQQHVMLRFELRLQGGRSVCRDFSLSELLALRIGAQDEKVAPVKLHKGQVRFSKIHKHQLAHKGNNMHKDTQQSSRLYLYFINHLPKNLYRLTPVKVDFNSSSERFRWESEILRRLKVYTRPKRLLIYINPFGGKKNAPSIYAKKVAPVFELAEIKTTIVTTERAEFVIEDLKAMEYERFFGYDGVIAVGGDGLWNETVTGAVFREQLQRQLNQNDTRTQLARPPITLGSIPAGSTNSICHTVFGTGDPFTAALHIALGHSSSVDVLSVHEGQKFVRFASLFASYGVMGYALKASETLRCMGPARYECSGIKTMFKNPAFVAKIQYRPLLQPYDSAQNMAEKYKGDYMKLPECVESCQVCGPLPSGSPTQVSWLDSIPSYPASMTGLWTSVTGCVITTKSRFSPTGLAPKTHFGDGTMDLALLRKFDRCQHMRFAMKIKRGKGEQFTDKNMILLRVSRFAITPGAELNAEEKEPFKKNLLKNRGSWNIDGEYREQTNITIHVRVHKQLISMFTLEAGLVLEPKRRNKLFRNDAKSAITNAKT